MKNIVKSSKIWMLALLSVLFLGVGIKAEAAPGTVSGVKQTNDTTNAVQIEWPAVSVGNPVEYKVEWCESANFTGSSYGEGTIAQTGTVISNLSAGKSYYVRVSAVDKDKTVGTASTPIEVVTAPAAKITDLKQGKLASKKISLSWSSVAGANCYDVGYLKYGSSSSTKPTYKETTSTSYTISASSDTKYAVVVYPMRKSSAGYIASGDDTTRSATMYMSTTPKKVSNLKVYDTGSNTSPTATIVTFSATLSNAADGYEYEIYGNNNKKISTKTVKASDAVKILSGSNKKVIEIKNGKLKNDQFLKIRIRPYVTVNNKKSYAKWSSYLWFAKTPKKVKVEITPSQRIEDGLNISWSKIKGANNYSVYVSRSSSSGYKKVTTTTGTSYNLRTFKGSQLTSGTYYFKVIANKKVGGKTYKSANDWYNSKSIRITYSY